MPSVHTPCPSVPRPPLKKRKEKKMQSATAGVGVREGVKPRGTHNETHRPLASRLLLPSNPTMEALLPREAADS